MEEPHYCTGVLASGVDEQGCQLVLKEGGRVGGRRRGFDFGGSHDQEADGRHHADGTLKLLD